MTTSDPPNRSRTVTLSLSREARWRLHHVLLDRLDREGTEGPPTGTGRPPPEVFRAFETLEDGGTRFTVAQLEAIRTVLVEYHHATTWWELERAGIERLLHRVTTCLDR